MMHHPSGCCRGPAGNFRAWIIALVFMAFLAGVIAVALGSGVDAGGSVASGDSVASGGDAGCPATAAGRSSGAGAEPVSCSEIHAGLGVRKPAAIAPDFAGGARSQP